MFGKSIPFFSLLVIHSALLSAQPRFPYNGSFEAVDGNLLPKIWYSGNISPAGSYTVTSDSTLAFDGRWSVLVRNTGKFNGDASAMMFQQLDLGRLPRFRRLKLVEYVKSGVRPDSSVFRLGANGSHVTYAIEPVVKGRDQWYKVSFACDIDSTWVVVSCWNVFLGALPVYVDDFQVFIDDKRVDDVALPPDDYP